MSETGRRAKRHDALVREAARDLAQTLALYGVLTRADLVRISSADHWMSVDPDAALECAIALGLIRRLDEDLYESLRVVRSQDEFG